VIDYDSLKSARNTISELMGAYKDLDPVRYPMYLQVLDDLEDMIEQVEEVVNA
jgi:hypothetical protein